MAIFLQLGRLFFLVAICWSTAFADQHPGRRASVIAPHERNATSPKVILENKLASLAFPQLDSISSNQTFHTEDPQSAPESFDFSAPLASAEDMAAKWSELQLRILADERALATCVSVEIHCSEAARRFLSIVELGRNRQGLARLGFINRAVNLGIRPVSDWVQYGFADFWASPLQTLSSGAGDCEDYAIVKYVALRELGIPSGDLRFVIVLHENKKSYHAVVAVRDENKWLILDNRTMAMVEADRTTQHRPLFVSDKIMPFVTGQIQ